MYTLILFVVALLLTELLRPKPRVEDARAAGLGDFKFPTATEGRVVPIVFGRVKTDGMNVVWFGNLLPVPLTKFVKKNLWSGFRTITGYKYYLGIQGVLARGECAVRRVFIGDQEVWSGLANTDGYVIQVDQPELFGGDQVGVGGVQMDLQFYTGSQTQAANDYLEQFQALGTGFGPGNVQPTYAGNCYIVARKLGSSGQPIPTLTDPNQFWAGGAYIGNSESLKPWSFELERYSPAMPGQPGGEHIIGVDSNPINVAYELFTNAEWGGSESPADIDVAEWIAAASVLYTEGNGFSFLLASEKEAGELLQEIERQINGVFFIDVTTGKRRVKLARADYLIASQPLVDDDVIVELRDFTRGTWKDTINQVLVEFDHRENSYKLSNALAQDTANMLMQGGGSFSTVKVVPSKLKFPGVKSRTLAQAIASRELRDRSCPIAKATVVVQRTMFALTVGSVVRFSSTTLQIVELPMRIGKIDFGTLTKNVLTLWLVEDIFSTQPGMFGDPPLTGWSYPNPTLVAYTAAQQLAGEAPRALVVRDPDYGGDPTVSKVFVAVGDVVGGVSARISQRNAVGSPTGAFLLAGQLGRFAPIGKLQSGIAAGVANPTATLTILCDPSAQVSILQAFSEAATLTEMGVELAGLILVGTEFMLVQSAVAAGANVTLQGVYRGALDSAQTKHLANDPVFFVCGGAAVADSGIPNTNNVEIELRQQSESDTFSGSVSTIAFTMAKRPLRPYPPSAVLYNGSGTPFTTPSIEGAGSGIGGFRIDVAWWRRNFQTVDELQELLADRAVDASTEYRLTVTADPDGAATLVGAASAWTSGAGPLAVTRNDILTAAAAGTKLRFALRARHDIGTDLDLQSRYDLVHDVIPTSTLTGLFYFGGGLAVNVASFAYSAAATGTFTVAIGAAQTTAAIQVRVNGGAWTTVVVATATSGTFSASSGNTIELRRTVNEAPQPNYFELRNPSSTVVGYGTFKN